MALPLPAASLPDDLAILQELAALPEPARPLQFGNLLTAGQYLPIYRLARRYLRPGLRALDWGCGNGHFSYFLLRQGLAVEGFNLAAQSNPLEPILRQRFAERYGMTYGSDDEPVALPYPDRRFDLVCSIGVLEHVRETGGDEVASLKEIRRVLKPGGHFLCGMLPKRYSWIELLVRTGAPRKHWHRYRYTKAEIGGLLARAGLRLAEIGSHGFVPRNSLSHARLRPLHHRPSALRALNALDRGLTRAAAPIAQNFLLAATRPL
jgi:SAM-dependent methyltransferase